MSKWLQRWLNPDPQRGPRVTIHWNGAVSIDWIGWLMTPEGQRRTRRISRANQRRMRAQPRVNSDGARGE
jgi:hypothetical protein